MPRSVRRGRPPWSRSDLPPARARTKRLTSWSSNSLSPELVVAIVIWRLSTLHKVQWREQRRKRAHENTDKDLLLRGVAAERCVFMLFDIQQTIPSSFAIGFLLQIACYAVPVVTTDYGI